MSTVVENIKLALSVLTRIPIMNVNMNKAGWAESCAYFPLCGYIVAIPTIAPALILLAFNIVYSPILLAAWSIFCIVIVTGAMHLDGFADICDGFGCHAEKERRIEIMHDPRVGSFGISGIITLLLIKFSAFYVVYQNNNILPAASIIVLARTLLVFTAYYAKPAEEKGMGSLILSKISKTTLFTALTISIPCLLSMKVILPIAIMMGTSFFIVKKSYSLIGGINGDVIGAQCELTEAVGLFTLATLISI